jgi:hypothetical protein
LHLRSAGETYTIDLTLGDTLTQRKGKVMALALSFYGKSAERTKELPHILSVAGYQQKVLAEKYDAVDEEVLQEFRTLLENAYAGGLSDSAREALWKTAHTVGVAIAGRKYAYLEIEEQYMMLVGFLKEATM